MNDLLEIERDLAGVLTIDELTSGVLERLREVAGASGAMVFSFDASGFPTVHGGSLTEAMRGYTEDLYQEDLLQSYSVAKPKETFLVHNVGDFDVPGHLRSRPYVDFYRPNEIGDLCTLWPTGLQYGTDGMFGVFLCAPSFRAPLDGEALNRLRRLEPAMRASARRIARWAALEKERDVLRHLAGATRGAFVLWDQDARPVWASPQAGAYLQGKAGRDELDRAAVAAVNGLRDGADPRVSLFARPSRIDPGRGGAFFAEFSSIRAADHYPWLLAELTPCDGAHAKLATLTAAETRVLGLLVRGLANREIAAALFVSNETVRTHVSRILHKLDVSSRSKAASLAREAWRGRDV